jgi:hypothetical protein
MIWRREKSLACAGIQTMGLPAHKHYRMLTFIHKNSLHKISVLNAMPSKISGHDVEGALILYPILQYHTVVTLLLQLCSQFILRPF